MFKRWRKLEKDFIKKDGTFDISKIPDICDNIKFDVIHNPCLLDEQRRKLFEISQLMSQAVVPLEYGVTNEEKLAVGF
jgi:inositol hexakisphosphate/diphosphoinositol-pentakisphosphate kinase